MKKLYKKIKYYFIYLNKINKMSSHIKKEFDGFDVDLIGRIYGLYVTRGNPNELYQERELKVLFAKIENFLYNNEMFDYCQLDGKLKLKGRGMNGEYFWGIVLRYKYLNVVKIIKYVFLILIFLVILFLYLILT